MFTWETRTTGCMKERDVKGENAYRIPVSELRLWQCGLPHCERIVAQREASKQPLPRTFTAKYCLASFRLFTTSRFPQHFPAYVQKRGPSLWLQSGLSNPTCFISIQNSCWTYTLHEQMRYQPSPGVNLRHSSSSDYYNTCVQLRNVTESEVRRLYSFTAFDKRHTIPS